MKEKIINNYLLLTKQSDFSKSLGKYFFERLQLFLCVNFLEKEYPTILFINNLNKINELTSNEDINGFRALYLDDHNIILFHSEKYKINSDVFRFDKYKIQEELDSNLNGYKYIIPLSDIYHELIHRVQHQYTNTYNYTDFIEATDEILTFILTGQLHGVEYYKESIAFWNFGRKFLKLKLPEFYIFLVNSIVNPNFNEFYLLSNKRFINLLSRKYNGNISTFYNNFKNDFGKLEMKDIFIKDLIRLHNLIFYKF
jgi:hypothetical protein